MQTEIICKRATPQNAWRTNYIRRERVAAFIALLPALGLFGLFVLYPLGTSLFYATTDWDGLSTTYNIIGFSNFAQVFRERSIQQAFSNTLYFALLSIPSGIVLQLLLAVLLTQSLRGRSLLRTILYIPAVFSPVIVSFIWSALLQYDGVINNLLRSTGFGILAFDWLGDIYTVKNVIIGVNLWQFVGTGVVIFIASINGVPQELNEAACIDGANGWQVFFNITLPLIMPAITIVLFLSITGSLRIFELPFILTGGGPRNASTTIVMQIYNNAFGNQRFGFATALGLVFFVFIATLTLTQIFVTRKYEVEY